METKTISTKTLKERLHQYVDNATEEQLNELLSFAEEETEILPPEVDALLEDEEFWKEQDRRYEELESGKVKAIPYEDFRRELDELINTKKKH